MGNYSKASFALVTLRCAARRSASVTSSALCAATTGTATGLRGCALPERISKIFFLNSGGQDGGKGTALRTANCSFIVSNFALLFYPYWDKTNSLVRFYSAANGGSGLVAGTASSPDSVRGMYLGRQYSVGGCGPKVYNHNRSSRRRGNNHRCFQYWRLSHCGNQNITAGRFCDVPQSSKFTLGRN